MNDLYHPLRSLGEGNWFKLICGASFQHLPSVRNLTLAYTLAGVDCVDVAADPAVVNAAKEALQVACHIAGRHPELGVGFSYRPWLMVSLNDSEDPHFRKVEFDPNACPPDCSRPCERICPAQAIVFNRPEDRFSGVVDSRCYGCGRCLPVCPVSQISTRSYVATPAAIAPLVLEGIDAIEIHTQVGRLADFKRLWQAIIPWIPQLQLVAISCPDGEGLIDYLRSICDVITPLPTALVWQTDGRPMSGDIGKGATRAAVKLGERVLAADLPGYVQLAGGTNQHTVAKLRSMGLLNNQQSVTSTCNQNRYIAGIAYGSYARVLLAPVLDQLEDLATPEVGSMHQHLSLSASNRLSSRLESVPELLFQAVSLAHALIGQLKLPMMAETEPLSMQKLPAMNCPASNSVNC
ncbi:MAG: 4Fe-4S ferredoxin [Cyanothece sp. SIO1E1]|nr:4Fe-4S ferredoxin [Cyanothece sp. SIO1E1]